LISNTTVASDCCTSSVPYATSVLYHLCSMSTTLHLSTPVPQ
jgi:hypothetical protein